MAFDKSRFIDQFKTETRERIQALSLGLLKLEKSSTDRELLNSMMREAHSIKGAAGMMGYKRIADITHKMEGGLQRALNGELNLTDACFEVFFKCLDALEPLLHDKVTWDDAGINRDFTEDLCVLAEKVFSGQSPDEVPETAAGAKIAGEVSPPAVDEEAIVNKAAEFTTLAEDSVRVDVAKLNRLINLSGELLVSKIRLEELSRDLQTKTEARGEDYGIFSGMVKDLTVVTERIDLLTENMQDEMLKVRMLPMSYLFNMFPRAMRDLAKSKGKDLDFVIAGQDTQLDRAILDEMKIPLMHLLRNSVDHGIESPEERKQQNKPSSGRIRLAASREGSQVVISVTDDGRGIDVGKIKEMAVAKGLVSREHVQMMVDEQVFQLLFTPGFSTREEVSEISGRGVGLDVVRDIVIKLKGMVEVTSDPLHGTSFNIRLPLTLAITESLLVMIGSDMYAIPVDSVIETVRVNMTELKTVETKEVITVRGHILPVVKLRDIFGLPMKGIFEKRFFPILIVQSVEKRIGILVDELLGRQEVILKSIGDPLKRVRHLAGAAILGSGKVVMVLDVPMIIHSAEGGAVRGAVPGSKGATGRKQKTILLAEDTLTTAMLEKNILESVGYSVVIARDGKEALEKASLEKFDLVISDVLMPNMDGFELVTRLRKDKDYRDVPIVIVTTRESDEDKRKGMEVGASAYLLKSDFTSEGLLETLERLLG